MGRRLQKSPILLLEMEKEERNRQSGARENEMQSEKEDTLSGRQKGAPGRKKRDEIGERDRDI